ncbi:hypothetical protein ACJX0J_018497, partial [Zea mays]
EWEWQPTPYCLLINALEILQHNITVTGHEEIYLIQNKKELMYINKFSFLPAQSKIHQEYYLWNTDYMCFSMGLQIHQLFLHILETIVTTHFKIWEIDNQTASGRKHKMIDINRLFLFFYSIRCAPSFTTIISMQYRIMELSSIPNNIIEKKYHIRYIKCTRTCLFGDDYVYILI